MLNIQTLAWTVEENWKDLTQKIKEQQHVEAKENISLTLKRYLLLLHLEPCHLDLTSSSHLQFQQLLHSLHCSQVGART